MSEREDDTPETGEGGRAAPDPPRGYYYDDATGYEVYRPEEEEEECDGEGEGKTPATYGC